MVNPAGAPIGGGFVFQYLVIGDQASGLLLEAGLSYICTPVSISKTYILPPLSSTQPGTLIQVVNDGGTAACGAIPLAGDTMSVGIVTGKTTAHLINAGKLTTYYSLSSSWMAVDSVPQTTSVDLGDTAGTDMVTGGTYTGIPTGVRIQNLPALSTTVIGDTVVMVNAGGPGDLEANLAGADVMTVGATTGIVANFVLAAAAASVTFVSQGTYWQAIGGSASGGVALCSAIPPGVSAGSSGSAGVAADAARCDHEHPVPVAAPAALGVGDAGGAGASTDLVRADHEHAVPRGTPVATGVANAAGASSSFAGSDHVHETALAVQDEGVAGGTAHTANFVGAGVTAAVVAGVATVTVTGGVALCSAIPPGVSAGSSGSAGVAADAARCDHEHPVPVAAPAALGVGDAGGAGGSTDLVRADHEHAVVRGTPVATGTANAAGAGTEFVGHDHVHETALAIQDEGVAGGTAHTANFVGPGVTAVVAAGVATVTIPGGSASIPTGNTLWVDAVNGVDGTAVPGSMATPGQFLTIGAALTASTSGDVVIVRPGTYAEEGLTVPTGVAIRGEGGWQTTFIGFSSGRTANTLTLTDETTIQGLTFYVSASASFASVAYSGGGGTNTAGMYEIRFLGDGATGVGIGIDKTGPGKIIGAEIRFDLGGVGVGMQTSSGAIALEGIHYPPGAGTFNTGAQCTGTGRLQLADFNLGNPNITDAIEVSTGTVLIYGANIFGANAVHMTADGAFVGIYGGKIETTALDFLLDPGVTWTNATTVQVTAAHQAKYSFPPSGIAVDFELSFLQESNATDESQFAVYGGGASFGFPEHGAFLHTGRGRSYVQGMQVITTDNTAGAGADGGNLTDVTTAASTRVGSTFTFQGTPATSAGASIAFTTLRVDVASVALQFWGILLHQATAGVGGTYIVEVRTAVNTWVPVGYQSVNEATDVRYGADLFLRAGTKEDLRLGVYGGDPDPLLPDGTAWPATALGAFGTGRWARIRVVTAVTTLPAFERLAIAPSHTQFNAEGESVAHGLALWRKTLSTGGNVFGESGGVVNASIAIGSGGLPTGWNHIAPNAKLNQNGDAIYFQFALQDGLCTAYPVRIKVVYSLEGGQPVTTAPSCILSFLPVEVTGAQVADPAGGVASVPRALANTDSLTANAAQSDTENLDGGATLPATLDNFAHEQEFGPFDITGFYEDDLCYIRFELDADGTPNQDVTVWALIISAVAFSDGAPL